MKLARNNVSRLVIIICSGLLLAGLCQLFPSKPVTRNIHVRSFRYGKDPYVIRCNRGDTLKLTFSTDDTGHSFFLEEFDIDVKISPSNSDVIVFKTSDPAAKQELTKEVVLVAKHKGLLNILVSRSNYRCHVWCGPMHAFEQGKLVIMPNTVLFFSLGALIAIFVLWLIPEKSRKDINGRQHVNEGLKDILAGKSILRKIITSRYTQATLMLLTMLMIYIVVLTSVFGTKVSGRNIGVLLMWAVWLFVLVAVLTPFTGRTWCTICPLPFFGDLMQRKSFFYPLTGKTGKYNNRFAGLFRKWPAALSNNWPRLFLFLVLATFSTTLVATPIVSGFAVLGLLIIPTIMSGVWELRSFCRYMCPVSVFAAPLSRMSPLTLRNMSQEVCDKCKAHFCETGNASGWACPYGLNAGKIKDNSDCGLCLECMRSCTYNNVSLFSRKFAVETGSRNFSEAWMSLAIFTIAIIYSILYLGPWPLVRDFVNILDKQNWGLFAIYSMIMWSLVLFIVPGIVWLLSAAGNSLSGSHYRDKDQFLLNAGMLLPFSLMNWIAFVIPMLFVNVTFIIQSLSDPFGWGWDFFGTANTPWHQFLPGFIPVFQSVAVLSGLYLSLRNMKKRVQEAEMTEKEKILNILPYGIFSVSVAIFLIFFFTN